MIGDETLLDGGRTRGIFNEAACNIRSGNTFGKFFTVVIAADEAEKSAFDIQRCQIFCDISGTACAVFFFVKSLPSRTFSVLDFSLISLLVFLTARLSIVISFLFLP